MPISLDSRLFLGGYEDPFDFLSTTWQDKDQSRFSDRYGLLEDLANCWSSRNPDSFNPCDPSFNALAYYPLKIVAAEWVKYVAVMYRAVKQFEYTASVTNIRDELNKLNADMRSLQSWRRRSMASEHKVKAVIKGLSEPTSEDAASILEDFEYIASTMGTFGQRLESMLPVVTSLVQIIDSRRSIDETANVSRLTVMALVFVPLAYIASLFSMSERLGPGGPLFWVYFVVAIPVTTAVVLIAKPPLSVFRKVIRRIQIPWKLDRRATSATERHVKKSEV